MVDRRRSSPSRSRWRSEAKRFPVKRPWLRPPRSPRAPPDDLRIAYSVALGGYAVTHDAKCWLLTSPDQAEPGTPLPPVPPELLKDVDSQENVRVQVGDKQEGFGSSVRPSGRKLWDKYPIEFGDGMYTRGEFIRIDKGNLREFLRAVQARNGRLGVLAYYFRSRYFTLPEAAKNVVADEWQTKLQSVIRQFDPKAVVVVENGTYVYRYHAQTFKMHTIDKTGAISETAHDEEGPNVNGILLKATLEVGPYSGAAVIPQDLKGPYWTTFINAYAVTAKQFVWLTLSYGSRSDKKLLEAIKTCFGPVRPPKAGAIRPEA